MSISDERARARRRRRRPHGAPTPAGPGGGTRLDPRFAEYRATGDRAVRNELVEDHRWLAVHCARQFARKGEPLDDLVQVAAVGILKAVDRFDPTYGTAFTTYAVPTVTGELRRHFRDRTWSVHVPRRAKDLYQSVSGVAEELSQTLMRSPTVPEIAQRSGTTVEEALEALEVRASYRGVPLATPEDDDRRDAPGPVRSTGATRPPRPGSPSGACWRRCPTATGGSSSCGSSTGSRSRRSRPASASARSRCRACCGRRSTACGAP